MNNNIPDEDDDQEFDSGANYDPSKVEIPNALKHPSERVLTRAQIETRLKNSWNIEKDECAALYPNDDDLAEFYYNLVLKSNSFGEVEDLDDGTKKKPIKDDYKMSRREKFALKDIELEAKRAKVKSDKAKIAKAKFSTKMEELKSKLQKSSKKKGSATITGKAQPAPVQSSPEPVAAEEAEAKAAFEQAGAHLPDEDKVSFEEAKAAIAAIRERRNNKKG